MVPAVELIESMELPIEFERPLIGQAAFEQTGENFPDETKAAIDAADATFLAPPAATARQHCFICAGVNKPLPTSGRQFGFRVTNRQWQNPRISTL